jgi:hypothetical protein
MPQSRLEKVKILIVLQKAREGSANIDTRFALRQAIIQLQKEYRVKLYKTTPMDLYGKPYGKLSKAERNEYAQIKRLLGRAQCKELR